MTLRKCEGCGKDYRPIKGNQKLCPVCKAKKPVQKVYHRICDNPKCKKPFDTTVYNKLCCSSACTQEKHRDHSHDERKRCPVCGRQFITGNSKKIHCSATCAKVTKAEYDKKWREEHPEVLDSYKAKRLSLGEIDA